MLARGVSSPQLRHLLQRPGFLSEASNEFAVLTLGTTATRPVAVHEGFPAAWLATGSCKRPDMSKSIRLPVPLPEYGAGAREADHPEKQAFDQGIPTSNTRPVSSELADRIQIWVNEGGAGGEVR
jgi:hypothetical protein